MVLKILMLANFVTNTGCLPHKSCDRIKIFDNWYEKKVIARDMGRPYSLNVHKATNTLFFSHSLEEYADVDFQLFFINLNTKEEDTIAGIRGGCAVAIDQGNDEIYLGGSDGIYKFNMLTKIADTYKEKSKNIWSLYYKNNLFYVNYPDQTLFIEIDGKFVKVKEFENTEIDLFHISSNNELYFFANKTGFYKYDSATLLVEVISELVTVRQITEDNDGIMYVCTNFGIYTFIQTNEEKFKKILDVKNIYGLAFDKDSSLVFSDEKNIILLKQSVSGCVNEESRW